MGAADANRRWTNVATAHGATTTSQSPELDALRFEERVRLEPRERAPARRAPRGLGLFAAFGIPFAEAYPVVAWIAWVPNLIPVEWFPGARTRNVGADVAEAG